MSRDRIDYTSISTRLEPHDVRCDCGSQTDHIRDECDDKGGPRSPAPEPQWPRTGHAGHGPSPRIGAAGTYKGARHE